MKDNELVQYNLWLDYLDYLESTDASTAPDIDWPEMPI
ncbi:phage tail protein [Escherichia coli]|nr:phage tail protein [Escherichia coli]